MITPVVRILETDEWETLREMRLRTLTQSPHAFNGDLSSESEWGPERWQEQLKKFDYLVASIEGQRVGGMSVELLTGDFGATCWIGSCWVDQECRRRGILRTMIDYLDSKADLQGWHVQGLGVWTDNSSAIAAYEKLGFVPMGEMAASTSQPGKHYQRMIRKTSDAK